jgi:cytochrome bd ubiquinol oxidase subunit I
MEALDLARIQFAFTVSFHFFFPAFTIGLASFLAVLEAMWLRTGKSVYLDLFDQWKIIFAVVFGMGVVSGIVMSYQFGSNWPIFADRTGPVLGPLMGYEVLSAFFLEAGFLGVMLFGRERVGHRLHFFATSMVAVGTLFSAFWILSVNSWMHTPTGYDINEVGQFVPVSWWEIVINPSFPYRLVHTVLAAYLTTAFVIGGAGAWHLLRREKGPAATLMFSMAMWMAALVAPLQILAGDFHGINTFEHQPAKIAAMEGHYDTHSGAPLILFGIPDDEAEEVRYALSIPKLGSMILTHHWDGEVRGLTEWAREDRPPAEIVFWSFRIMVAIGFAMAGIGLWSLVRRRYGGLTSDRWLLRAAVVMGPSGFAAVLAGWVTTEVGRQPFTVYGLLRTSESVAASVGAGSLTISLAGFIIVYFFVFGMGIYYVLRLMSADPDHGREAAETGFGEGPIRTSGVTPVMQVASTHSEEF